MQADMNNGGRWHHIASEREIKACMNGRDNEIIEVPAIGCTFVANRARLTILRTGAMGGDQFAIEGGWVFASDLLYLMDLHEIRHLSENSSRV